MATFRCPICKRNHIINRGDDMDYICDNSSSQYKKFQNMETINALTANNWNFNKFSTKEDAYRDVTIIKPTPLIPGSSKELGGGRGSKNW